MPLECHWLTQCTLGYHWATQRILAGYTRTPLEKLSWKGLTLGCHWRNSNSCSLHWNTPVGIVTPPPPPPPPLMGWNHWTNHTGTTLADASTQWCPSGDPVLICIIGTHWNTTGIPVETHWLPTILSLVAFQCTLGLYSRHTGLPLDYHWITTGSR